mgnify:FL=1
MVDNSHRDKIQEVYSEMNSKIHRMNFSPEEFFNMVNHEVELERDRVDKLKNENPLQDYIDREVQYEFSRRKKLNAENHEEYLEIRDIILRRFVRRAFGYFSNPKKYYTLRTSLSRD